MMPKRYSAAGAPFPESVATIPCIANSAGRIRNARARSVPLKVPATRVHKPSEESLRLERRVEITLYPPAIDAINGPTISATDMSSRAIVSSLHDIAKNITGRGHVRRRSRSIYAITD